MNSRWVCEYVCGLALEIYFSRQRIYSVGRHFCCRSWAERFWKNLLCHSWLQQKSCGGLRVWGACLTVSKPLSRKGDCGGEVSCTQVGWQLLPGQQGGSALQAL